MCGCRVKVFMYGLRRLSRVEVSVFVSHFCLICVGQYALYLTVVMTSSDCSKTEDTGDVSHSHDDDRFVDSNTSILHVVRKVQRRNKP